MSVTARVFALVVCVLVLGCGEGRPGNPGGASAGFATALTRADSLVAQWVSEERVSGAVLRISRDGTTEMERAYGHAQLYGYGEGQYDGGRPGRLAVPVSMTTTTRFDLASVTKVMATTFALMVLVDDDAVELDAALHTYLPRFRGEQRDRITIRHLLTHRAGLVPWQPLYYQAGDGDEAYEAILDLPLHAPPGSERRYSDLSFMLLARVVEAVSGMTLDDFLAERMYEPLGLLDTGFNPTDGPYAATSHGNPFERRMVHDSEFGYVYNGDPNAWNDWRQSTLLGQVNDGNAFHAFQGVAGHAGLFSTAQDLVALLELVLKQGAVGTDRYVSASVVEEFLSVGEDRQALGWLSLEFAPEGSFGHTGFTGTFVLGVPSQRLAIVLLTNRQNVGVDDGTTYADLGPLQEEVVRLLTMPDPGE